MKQASSRQDQILKLLLDQKNGLSIDDMAMMLSISRNAIKQHLVVLDKALLIQKHLMESTGGRPAQRYSLTTAGINQFPKQYAWFSNLILNTLKEEMGATAFKAYMVKLGVNLAHSLIDNFNGKSDADKISALVEVMQSLGYHAQLDDSSANPTIVAFNCIYHDLAHQHPEVCEFDHALISTLLDKPIIQTDCMARNDCVCKFLIQSKAKKEVQSTQK